MADEWPVDLTDLADGRSAAPGWDAWLATHPDEAAEVAASRRVQALLSELSAMRVPVPVDFEARLFERCRQDTTLLQLLDLGLAKAAAVLLALLDAFFDLLPASQPAAATP